MDKRGINLKLLQDIMIDDEAVAGCKPFKNHT